MDALADGALERFRPHLRDALEAAEMVIRQRVAEEIAKEILMYDQEWSANTWRSISARIAREVGNR